MTEIRIVTPLASTLDALTAVLPHAQKPSTKTAPYLSQVQVTAEAVSEGRVAVVFRATDKFTIAEYPVRLFPVEAEETAASEEVLAVCSDATVTPRPEDTDVTYARGLHPAYWADRFGLFIPADAAAWILTQGKDPGVKDGASEKVVDLFFDTEAESGNLTVVIRRFDAEDDEARGTFDLPERWNNYPPVARITLARATDPIPAVEDPLAVFGLDAALLAAASKSMTALQRRRRDTHGIRVTVHAPKRSTHISTVAVEGGGVRIYLASLNQEKPGARS